MAGHRSHSSIDMIYSVYNSYANHPSLNFPEDDDDNEKHGDAASVHTVASISSATGLTSPMTAEFGHARRRSRSREMSDSTNSYESISADFAAMKKNFGASMVRIYGQSCRTLSLYESIVQAAADNNMGVILMVWFGFDGTDVWETAQTSLYSLFTTSSLSTLALYVVHSVDFGSEPIGDQVDGGSVQFTAGLKAFRDRMNGYGVKVGISEDWDREGIMSGSDGTGLGSVGQGIADNSDYVHAHIMPYYHGSEAPDISDAWPYITKQMAWFADTLPGLPLIITESPWAWEQGTGHDRDSNEDAVSLSSFTTYWNTFAKNCATFKKAKVGWFIHTYTDYFEPGFGLLDASGDQPRILGYYPAKC
ncbi:B-(1-6) glucan synthase [Pseudohyphozyma bogoriensis]|nr:B-(1-6) glucan synthase [Pseudohyphozyma bogoriensis]